MAAPSSIETAIYTLSTCFKQRGREGPWSDTTLTGNPTTCQRLTAFLLGYKKKSALQGFKSTGAKALTQAKMALLLQHLQRQQLEPNAMLRHVAARDAFAFSFLWVTGSRGITAGDLTCADIQLPDGSPAYPLIYPQLLLVPGSILMITPRRLKTSVGANTQSVFVTMEVATSHVLCPVYWLHICISTAAACGSPIGAADHPVRKLEKGNQSVSADQATTGLLGKRLITHLQAAHCYEGESMHSFRRGRAIADTAAGLSDADIMVKLLLKTPAVLKQKYQPPGRHNSGVKRIRSSVQPVSKGCMPSSGPQPSPS
ncbi:hypothetical protein WJX84_012404 [Apatococcus fuscideae]|uniref:Uncharacterized protein n=1 Tax=Apatococcus fuscideae TaxID=2026836 RepID=A0AAW1T8E1_9CHLO